MWSEGVSHVRTGHTRLLRLLKLSCTLGQSTLLTCLLISRLLWLRLETCRLGLLKAIRLLLLLLKPRRLRLLISSMLQRSLRLSLKTSILLLHQRLRVSCWLRRKRRRLVLVGLLLLLLLVLAILLRSSASTGPAAEI